VDNGEVLMRPCQYCGKMGTLADDSDCPDNPNRDRTLTLTFSAKAFLALKSALAVRSMTDNAYGPVDDVAKRIVSAIDDGEACATLKTRKERLREQG